MKSVKKILFLLILNFVIINLNAQTGLNFQGVARTSNNVILASQSITIRLTILRENSDGTKFEEYVETRKVTTNAQGLFTAVIGDTGTISKLGNFATINWKLSPKFLKIEMDPTAGSNFITMGTTQFQYVAYAQFANSVDAENIVGVVPVSRGGTGANSLSTFKTSLALNNVNNTADLSKPISSLTQTALDLKLNAADTSKYTKQTYTDSALVAKQVLIGSKLNAADTSKYTKQTYSDSSLLTKLKISDTAAMLSRRIDRDTLSLSNRINSKISPSDSVLFQNDIKINGISIGVGSGIASATSTNVLIGKNALKNNTDGYWNTAIGYESLKENTTGGSNTSIGSSSLSKNTTGASNTATGSAALLNNTTGSQNTAIGRNTLLNNTSGNQNTAIGAATLYSNTTGTSNTATGQFALFSNTTGTNNTAIGQNALSKNTTGNFNTALSSSVLNSNTLGSHNIAIGNSALFYNTIGDDNTAVGNVAIGNNIDGDGNTAIGRNALDDIRTGNNNTAVGKYSGTLGDLSNTVAIGYNATATASNTIQLGDNNITDVKTSGVITSRGLGIGTKSNTSAALEVNSSSQGFLPPRMTAAQRDNIVTPVAGLVVWCSNCADFGELQVYNGSIWTNMIGGAVSLVPSSSPPPIAVEASIVFSIDIDPGVSNILAVVGATQAMIVNISSTIPTAGVNLDVIVRKSSDNSIVFSSSISSTTSVNNITISGLTAGVLCTASVSVTSKSTSANTLTKTFKLARK